MPIEYWIDADQSLIVTRATATLSDTAVIGFLNGLVDDTGWQNGMNGFVDLQNVDKLELTGETIMQASQIATLREDRFAGSRWAIVADRDAAFGIARMYELRRNADSYEVQVFRDCEPALDWLEVELPQEPS